MFNKILIANRGEIACRIARSARQMGIKTVAVYSDADQNALHVNACDEAVHIGGSAPAQSYLLADKMIQTALDTGAQAIHPGFGFLSENADFAEACAEHELIFIGPGAEAIRSMGSKSAARQIMQKAGVPVLPGFDGAQQDPVYLQQQAQQIGYPLLIKAVAGGGGKGLRAVNHADVFVTALGAVKRESLGAFADDTVLLERYLPVARHIEIQLFADTQGNVVHLYDRDCSMQRRHQKVIEEAPAPHISDAIRSQMADAAIACAKAVDYVGAGTVEFLLAPDGQFYFMEMNTRLQVEHPVSEMITDQDLVGWQFVVASGQPLPLQQAQISLQGHAIEARIYAENPQQNFLPSTGYLEYLKLPDQSEYVRIDTGVTQGDEISPYYDPMIAKLICHAEDREQALLRLQSSLYGFKLIGPRTNIQFLATLCAHSQVTKGGYDTRFIEHHLEDLLAQPGAKLTIALIAASLYSVVNNIQQIADLQANGTDPCSPWACADHWRIGDNASYQLELQAIDPDTTRETITLSGDLSGDLSGNLSAMTASRKCAGISVEIQEKSYDISNFSVSGVELTFSLDGVRHHAVVLESKHQLRVLTGGNTSSFKRLEAGATEQSNQKHKGSILSPMPGKVIACPVKKGQTVQRGATLMVVEAMKMEHSITASHAGLVEAIHFVVGDQVTEGERLLMLKESSES